MMSDIGHVPAEVLADAAEGLLPTAEQAAIDEHLDRCTDCRQVAADLRDVPALLAVAPSPRIPDDVAARIEAALQAEPPLNAPALREPIATPARRRRTRRLPVWVGAAAVTVLGVSATVLGVRALDGSETTTSSGAVGASLEADRAAEAPDATLAAPPDRDYTADTLADQVQALLATDDTAADGREAAPGAVPGLGDTSGEPSLADGTAEELGPLTTPTGLAACIEALTGRTGVTPLAVDFATYEGQPAAILVLPDPADDAYLDVRVVGAACSASDDDLIAATRVPRP